MLLGQLSLLTLHLLSEAASRDSAELWGLFSDAKPCEVASKTTVLWVPHGGRCDTAQSLCLFPSSSALHSSLHVLTALLATEASWGKICSPSFLSQ